MDTQSFPLSLSLYLSLHPFPSPFPSCSRLLIFSFPFVLFLHSSFSLVFRGTNTEFCYQNFKSDLEFLEILWISIQISSTKESEKKDAEHFKNEKQKYFEISEHVTFVDFNGFLVRFAASSLETDEEFCSGDLVVIMVREKIRENNSESFSGTKNFRNYFPKNSSDENLYEEKFSDFFSEIQLNPTVYGFSLSKQTFVSLLTEVLPNYARKIIEERTQ